MTTFADTRRFRIMRTVMVASDPFIKAVPGVAADTVLGSGIHT